MQIIKAVPTNIITGALGVGKTTIIQSLLSSKPKNERWAVLVNEFGEIGVDGVLLDGMFNSRKNTLPKNQSIFFKEVPGGCMCCTSGLPMQIALNQLLAVAKPDRLLIEPTGLGHPKELVEVLTSEHYHQVLSLNSTLCLVDARKLSNKKWREHQTFKDQFAIADLILATKHELYSQQDKDNLSSYLVDIGVGNKALELAENGKVFGQTLEMLNHKSGVLHISRANNRAITRQTKKLDLGSTTQNIDNSDISETTNMVIEKENYGEGFYSKGWIWPSSVCFDHVKICEYISSLDVTRVKALLITDKGAWGFNGQDGQLEVTQYNEAYDSRLEVISNSHKVIADITSKIIKMKVPYSRV